VRFVIINGGRELETLHDLRIDQGDRAGEGVDTSISVKGIIDPRKNFSDASLFLRILSPGRNPIRAPQGSESGVSVRREYAQER
jgi:hypothetical protein